MSSIMSSKNDDERQKETAIMSNNPVFTGVLDPFMADDVTDTLSATLI